MTKMVNRTRSSVTLQVHCLSCCIAAVNPTQLTVLDLVILIKFMKNGPANTDLLHCKIAIFLLPGN